MGLLREDGTPKPALEAYAAFAGEMGLCQWFHFEDHRLDEAVNWMKRLGVKHLRTGLSWADSFRPGALAGESAEPQLRIMFPPNGARLELARQFLVERRHRHAGRGLARAARCRRGRALHVR